MSEESKEMQERAPDGASRGERARKACELRQAECPHEWALSTQRNGLLLWRFHQDDCPRCLKMWVDYWRGRAKSAEGTRSLMAAVPRSVTEETE